MLKRRLSPPNLQLHFSERRLLLVIGDLLVINGALWLTLTIRGSSSSLANSAWQQITWFLVLNGLWLLVSSLFDAYALARAASLLHSLRAASSAALLTTGIYTFVPVLTPALSNRRFEIALLPVLVVIGVAIWRAAYALVLVQPVFHQRALVIGAGWSGRTLVRAIAETGDGNGNPYRGTGYHLIGFIDDDPAKQGQDIEGVPVLGTRRDLMRLVHELRPDELIVAITHAHTLDGALFQAILDCRAMGVSVTTMASLYELMTGRVPVEHAGQELYVVMPLQQPAGYRLYLGTKRLFDVAAALVGCASLLVVCPIVWLVNRLTSPGDLFYWQERVGQGGRTFRVVKFRSMMMNAEAGTGAVWAVKNDDRVTPLGRILRKTRLDEVPQVWNVLKGEMSLIGPRPERPEFVNKLAEEIPFYRVRHAVRPGITGWAQVKYRYASSVDDSLIKLQYDLYYIKHQGLYMDILILLKTVQVVLGMQGR